MSTPNDSALTIDAARPPEVTFAVDSVQPLAAQPAFAAQFASVIFARVRTRKLQYIDVEATPEERKTGLRFLAEEKGTHSLVHAIHTAYQFHLPLTLRADHIWLTILQAFGRHVNRNAEKLRAHFVSHDGKKEIKIRNDDVLGGKNTRAWNCVVDTFTQEVKDSIKDPTLCDDLVSAFSTTTPVSLAASRIAVLHAMQNYFNLTLASFCGIPSVTLVGRAADFREMQRRVQRFVEFGMDPRWIEALQTVLQQLENTAAGNAPDMAFWQQTYKRHEGSGSTKISGWINVLFPDTKYNSEPNKHAFIKWDTANAALIAAQSKLKSTGFYSGGGIRPDDIPVGISLAPFTWQIGGDAGKQIPMNFASGFVGVSSCPTTGRVEPRIGWMVAALPDPEPQRRSIWDD